MRDPEKLLNMTEDELAELETKFVVKLADLLPPEEIFMELIELKMDIDTVHSSMGYDLGYKHGLEAGLNYVKLVTMKCPKRIQ